MPGLILVAPAGADPATALAKLESAFGGGTAGHGIDAVLIGAGMSETDAEAAARAQVPLVQSHGAAAIIVDHTRVAGRTGADGVHIETGLADIKAATQSFKPDRIVGAGNLKTRHAAMEAGSEDVDYVLFGRLRGDTHPEPHPKAVALAGWWADLMEVQVVLTAGNSIDALENLPRNIDFIALDLAVWEFPGGPASAIKKVRSMSSNVPEQAA
ncbi:MAG TPA: thiamine phosphate synthase [Afifellaceae bacterium]|nr:thiamine phosphate synthase [Afifellaceae bacterium]